MILFCVALLPRAGRQVGTSAMGSDTIHGAAWSPCILAADEPLLLEGYD